ncbi:DNA primase [Megasphaera vaginalis (ex Bordigoni et al. 2020)]|uniref:DNA primase n=1 Tax=Megasphaera vaginalis (ex Bordigoni et al. 2020) TaxID=2045301 RepID=UPI000C7A3BDA|nr:DNA primase [Megasphaera vaginalis (ex Bordigoni et al. 2020)]
MKKFSSEFIEQVRQANDIVSVVSDYLVLKRSGRNFWACCPFHNEKTASFSVAPDKGFFHCFGCHASGDVFTFIMKKENISFSEAVEILAARAHIALPAFEQTPAEQARERQRSRLYEINEMACTFFHNCLVKTHYGEKGLAYFRQRHVSDETIRTFRLGFAPDSWDKLTEAFQKKGIAKEELLLLGLAKESNHKVYDAFRNRVIFPIRDGRGKTVAFGGRVLDDSKPKYLNSPETPVFDKRSLLFAMDVAHKGIYEKGRAVLVEGYMDVISAHNRGITNVVASLGTAFTGEQARLLQRQSKELVLSYDMDGAGRQATLRAMEVVRGLGLTVRVVSLPQGKDPDEYINTAGAAAFEAAVAAAPNALEYMLQTAMQEHDGATLEGKSAITAMVFPALIQADSQIVIEAFLKRLSERLQISETAVRTEYNAYLTKHPEAGRQKVVISGNIAAANKTARGPHAMAVAEENILRFLMEKPDACARIGKMIERDFFKDEKRRGIYETLLRLHDRGGNYTQGDVQEQLAPEEWAELSRIMVLQDVPLDEKVVLDYVKRFRFAELQQAYRLHSRQAAAYSRTNDIRLLEELEACKKISDEMKRWS